MEYFCNFAEAYMYKILYDKSIKELLVREFIGYSKHDDDLLIYVLLLGYKRSIGKYYHQLDKIGKVVRNQSNFPTLKCCLKHRIRSPTYWRDHNNTHHVFYRCEGYFNNDKCDTLMDLFAIKDIKT